MVIALMQNRMRTFVFQWHFSIKKLPIIFSNKTVIDKRSTGGIFNSRTFSINNLCMQSLVDEYFATKLESVGGYFASKLIVTSNYCTNKSTVTSIFCYFFLIFMLATFCAYFAVASLSFISLLRKWYQSRSNLNKYILTNKVYYAKAY